MIPALGQGLLTSSGDVHKRQRRLMQPLFHHRRIASYVQAFGELAEAMQRRWQDGDVLDVDARMNDFTLEVIARCVFDVTINSHVLQIVREALATDQPGNSIPLPVMEKLPLPSVRRRRRTLARLDEVVMDLVEQRRSGTRGDDLLSLLLDVTDEDGGRMATRQVRDEILTVLLAGHETTANALTWATHLLATHPQVVARLQAEADDVLGDRLPTFEDVGRLVYTKAVLSETLRLYPPAWLMLRHLSEDRTICGFPLPAGSLLLISPYVLHHDERQWPDARAFRPERWLPDDDVPDGQASRHRYAYVPFGGGPRLCIGNSFAEMESLCCLAVLARRWTFAPFGDEPVRTQAAIMLRPRGGLKLSVRRRPVPAQESEVPA